jgi:pyruvate/2-oxoglutarate dehydrogenase complex dihydrolipoamide acyltransferase (E2) component
MSEETLRNIEKKYAGEMTKRKATTSEITEDSTALKAPDVKAQEQMDNLMKIQDDPYLLVENDKEQKIEKYMSTLSEEDIEGIKNYLNKPTAKINSVEDEEKMANWPKESGLDTNDQTVTAFYEGGLKDEGGTVDPVSGNDVPPGSTQEEVRDDIPAQLSEGEFVFPADVVRYIGLENLMELRQKAKQGLGQMEAMGQMGNSDEATISDTEPFEGDIDALIDEFDPDNPDTFEFNLGGVVPGQLTSSQTTPMYQPPATLPSFTSFIQQPAQQQAQSVRPVVEQREYVGPNGERIAIQFVNGREVTPIPDGYVPFDPTAEPVTPEIAKPEVIASQEDISDDRERRAKRDAQMAKDKEINNTLASYDEDFAKQWSEDPFNTGKISNPFSAISTSVQTHLDRTSAIEKIAKEKGIDLDKYKNTGLPGVFSKYDDEKFAKDLKDKYETLAEKAQREANEKARAPEIAALRAKEIERLSNLTADQQIAREEQKQKNYEATQARAAAIRESDGGGGEGGSDNAGGKTDSYSGDRDADGWGE